MKTITKTKIFKKTLITIIRLFKRKKLRSTFLTRNMSFKTIFPEKQCKTNSDCLEVYKNLMNIK